MNMSKVNETKDLEKDVLEKFQQLKVSVKIDVLNILLLVTTDKVMEFLKGIAITEKIMTAHGESNETLKAIRKIQEEKICAKKCKRNNQNVYRALRLVKDMTRRGNNGVSMYPRYQKIFGLTENFVAKMTLMQK